MNKNLKLRAIVWEIIVPIVLYYIVFLSAMYFIFAFIGHTASTYMIAQIISAAITIPFSAAMRRKPLIINSRAMIMMTNHAGRRLRSIIQIIAEHTSNLSARGSINLPKFVTRLFLRARYPSNQSVTLATTNRVREM